MTHIVTIQTETKQKKITIGLQFDRKNGWGSTQYVTSKVRIFWCANNTSFTACRVTGLNGIHAFKIKLHPIEVAKSPY